MRAGSGGWTIALAALCVVQAGCRSNPHRASVEKNLFSSPTTAAEKQAVAESYRVSCPDVLQIRVAKRPEFDAPQTVAPDGSLDLGRYGKIRVEGLTLPLVARNAADRLGVPPTAVQVRVVEFASRHLLLVGEVVGRHRAVPYQGDETVLDVLQRVGGITPGAEPTEIYVLRSHLADSLQRPEVFHVDLQSIVLKQDMKTNVRVQPYDHIHVGETRQARVEKCVPPWARPVYRGIWNMLPSTRTPQEGQHSFTSWFLGWFAKSDAPTP